jgi:hypothetical protein
MSLLINEAYANKGTPLWASAGSGGGGGVSSIIAGTGISVDTNTGDVTVSSTIVPPSTSVGAVESVSNTIGIENGDTWAIGNFKESTYYPNVGNYYIAGVTINLSNIASSTGNFDGNIWVTLDYSDGVSVSLQGRETIYLDHTADNYYSASVVIGFQHQSGGVLGLSITNQTGVKLNTIDGAITNFYCVDEGNVGSFGLPLF